MAETTEKTSFDVEQIKRNPWLMGLASVPWALIPALWVLAIATGQPAFAFPTIHFGILGALALLWTWRRNPWKRKKKVRVEIDDAAIQVGEQRVARSELMRGVIVPRDGNIEVHLAKSGPDLELRVDGAETARRIL